MRSFTPKIIENSRLGELDSQKKIGNNKNSMTKPIIQSYHLKKITPGFSMNDLDKIYPIKHQSNLSIINNNNSHVNCSLNNGNISRQNIGGSAPDLKKIFISEMI